MVGAWGRGVTAALNFLWRFVWLIPLTLVGLALWLPSLIPASALAVIGYVALSIGGIAGVALLVLAVMAAGMKS